MTQKLNQKKKALHLNLTSISKTKKKKIKNGKAIVICRVKPTKRLLWKFKQWRKQKVLEDKFKQIKHKTILDINLSI